MCCLLFVVCAVVVLVIVIVIAAAAHAAAVVVVVLCAVFVVFLNVELKILFDKQTNMSPMTSLPNMHTSSS